MLNSGTQALPLSASKAQRDWKNLFDLWTKTATVKTITVITSVGSGRRSVIAIKCLDDWLKLGIRIAQLETVESVTVGTCEWNGRPYTRRFCR